MWNYKQIYAPNHPKARSNGCVLEHRYVAEKKIGRFLEDEEVVHHIDEDRTNNSEDNLIVFSTQDDHARFHKTGKMVEVEFGVYISPMLTKECKHCKETFEYTNNTIEFCGQKCFKEYSRVVERPSKEEFINLLKSNSILKIGKMFGVSDNAIRRWCTYYNIPSKKKDLKEFLNNY